jgi:L-lactate dehydrogenase complex protein LldG
MNSAREQILGTIRRGLGRGELESSKRTELQARLKNPPHNVIPARAQLLHAERVELFVQMASESAATLDRVDNDAAVPATVAAYLQREGLSNRIVMAPDKALASIPWESQSALKIERRKAENGDPVSLTPAFAGIAETGTLMLLSGPHSPTTLNFLPDIHIVLLKTSRIVGPYEDAWTLLRERDGGMPRTINLITGPSRSADIEQKVQMGAHGPIRLHIVLVNE